VEGLIDNYCREPGVRSLERQIKKLVEKIAFKIVIGKYIFFIISLG
jgi:ATP-dependent Lon protease